MRGPFSESGGRVDTNTNLVETDQDFKTTVLERLDDYAKKKGINSLSDRVRIGLNETALFALPELRTKIKQACLVLVEEEAFAGERLMEELEAMVLDIQQSGPWAYADDLAAFASPVVKMFYALVYSQQKDYQRSTELTPKEFRADVSRLEDNLSILSKEVDSFVEDAREHLKEKFKSLSLEYYRFDRKSKEWVICEKDVEGAVPVGDGLDTMFTLAEMGERVGVVTNADGEVFLGTKGPVDEQVFSLLGLEKSVGKDDKDSRRTVNYYTKNGQNKIKEIHSGFFVFMDKDYSLPLKIAHTLREGSMLESGNVVDADRVVQSTESQRRKLEEVFDTFNNFGWFDLEKKQNIVRFKSGAGDLGPNSDSTELARPRDQFFGAFEYIRPLYVYLDALKLESARKYQQYGETLSEQEQVVLYNRIKDKQHEKVDELRYLADELEDFFDELPAEVDHVVDMAGGAGDFGLLAATQLLTRGHELRKVEIVDPQETVDEFMDVLIDYIPTVGQDIKKIAHHAVSKGAEMDLKVREAEEALQAAREEKVGSSFDGGVAAAEQRLEDAIHARETVGYLQNTILTDRSLVLAKHACGTLIDDTIELLVNSDAKYFVAMTCCQGKAADKPPRYGCSHHNWRALCKESDLTNQDPGPKLDRGRAAMIEIDELRINYLRRQGFRVVFSTTDKFAKGDVIVACKLPENFNSVLTSLEHLAGGVSNDTEEEVLGLLEHISQSKNVAHLNDLVERLANSAQFFANCQSWKAADFKELRDRFNNPPIPFGEDSKILEKRWQKAKDFIQKQNLQKQYKQREGMVFGGSVKDYIERYCDTTNISTPTGRGFGAVVGPLKKILKEGMASHKTDQEIQQLLKSAVRELLPPNPS